MVKKKPPSRVTVEVTQDDIDLGMQGSSRACPIALAAARALDGGFENVSVASDVGATFFTWKTGPFSRGRYTAYELPSEARAFIRDFDRGPVTDAQPVTFTMVLR